MDGISMKMSSPERRRFEGRSVAQHRPQNVDPPAGQCNQGLSVPLALSSLAAIEGSGLRRATQTGKRRLVESSLEDLVATSHPFVVASAFAGVLSGGDQPGVGGELVGALEGTEISHTDQKLGPEAQI